MNRRADIRHIAGLLSDPSRSEHPRTFPADPVASESPGLYSWWADTEAQNLFRQVVETPIGKFLYVGQAGATRWPSGRKSTATLKSRIRSNHMRGNLSSSTFRLTISALLRDPLKLHLAEPRKLSREDNRLVSDWIRDHLRVTIVPLEDRDSLEDVEQAVLDRLDPPLNLRGRPPIGQRRRLAKLRRAMTK